jgi:hypothetical protein
MVSLKEFSEAVGMKAMSHTEFCELFDAVTRDPECMVWKKGEPRHADGANEAATQLAAPRARRNAMNYVTWRARRAVRTTGDR